MSKEAMKLALESLEAMAEDLGRFPEEVTAITALREALAEQPAQQEPVATLWQHSETGRTCITTPDSITDCDARWFKAADLYTTPQPPAQQLTDEPEIVQRVMRYAGQTLRTARNPNITARECIELADWLAAHGITK